MEPCRKERSENYILCLHCAKASDPNAIKHQLPRGKHLVDAMKFSFLQTAHIQDIFIASKTSHSQLVIQNLGR